MGDVLAVIMRWLHLASVTILIGGLMQGALMLRATADALTPDAAVTVGQKAGARFRVWVILAIAALTLSGAYNLLSMPGHTPRYLILFAVKLLLVLHVFAVSLVAVKHTAPRRARLMAGAGISGLIIIFISAYLRRIF